MKYYHFSISIITSETNNDNEGSDKGCGGGVADIGVCSQK